MHRHGIKRNTRGTQHTHDRVCCLLTCCIQEVQIKEGYQGNPELALTES